MHDGPGLRTTVFLKGCPLRCKWCHNPETQKAKQEIIFDDHRCIGCRACGSVCEHDAHVFTETSHDFLRENCVACEKCTGICPTKALEPACRMMETDEIVNEVLKDLAFYGIDGGITVSGGEPMFHPQGTLELLGKCKEKGLTTAIETCGFYDRSIIEKLSGVCDLLLWDFKDSDSARHKENTGVPNEPILENLRYADSLRMKSVLRCIIIEGVNFTEEHIQAIADLRKSLKNCIRADLLPYHPMGDSKCRLVGADAGFHSELHIPDPEKLEAAKIKVNK